MFRNVQKCSEMFKIKCKLNELENLKIVILSILRINLTQRIYFKQFWNSH
jgi:hypothetical protein